MSLGPPEARCGRVAPAAERLGCWAPAAVICCMRGVHMCCHCLLPSQQRQAHAEGPGATLKLHTCKELSDAACLQQQQHVHLSGGQSMEDEAGTPFTPKLEALAGHSGSFQVTLS